MSWAFLSLTNALNQHYPYLNSEINYLYNSFKKVGFPVHILNQVHSRVKRKFFTPQRQSSDNSQDVPEGEQIPTISIPFNKFTQEYVKPVFAGNNFRVVNPATNSLRTQIVKNRPPRSVGVEPLECAGVYKVPCSGCDSSYYGETGRAVDIRIHEHQNAVRKKDTKNACYKHSATTKHVINWEGSKLLFQSDDWYNRLVF